MNDAQAAVFFALLSIPFTVAIGTAITRGIFRGVLILAAAAILIRRAIRSRMIAIRRAIRRAPSAAYDLFDRALQRMFPPRLEFQVEYATLNYYLRMSSRPLTLEAHLRSHLRAIGGAS